MTKHLQLLLGSLLLCAVLSAQKERVWTFGSDLSFGITEKTLSLNHSTITSGDFQYEIIDKASHGLHAGIVARRKVSEHLHFKTGLYWHDLTTKRLYKSIDWQEEGEANFAPPYAAPDKAKIRTTYGFISAPVVVEYVTRLSKKTSWSLEIGGGLNWNAYTHVRESEKRDGKRVVTREEYIDEI